MGFISFCSTAIDQLTLLQFPLQVIWKGLVLIIVLKATATLIKTFQTHRRLVAQRSYQPLASKLLSVMSKHHLSPKQILVVDNPQVLAYTSGWQHPQVIISQALIDQLTCQELEAVILHEKHHLEHHHPRLLLANQLLSDILFFLPVFGDLFHQLKLFFENQADLACINHQQTDLYLKSALAKAIQPQSLALPALAAAFLDQRIQLMTLRRTFVYAVSKTKLVWSVGIMILLITSFAAIPAVALPSSPETTASTVINRNCRDLQLFSPLKPVIPSHNMTISMIK